MVLKLLENYQMVNALYVTGPSSSSKKFHVGILRSLEFVTFK